MIRCAQTLPGTLRTVRQPTQDQPEPADPDAAQTPADSSAASTATPSSPSAPASSTSSGLLAVGLLIAIAMIGGLAIMAVRKKMLTKDADDSGLGSLMDDLRRSLRAGSITQQEFDAAKRAMVAKLTGSSPAPKSGLSKTNQ